MNVIDAFITSIHAIQSCRFAFYIDDKPPPPPPPPPRPPNPPPPSPLSRQAGPCRLYRKRIDTIVSRVLT